MISNQKNQAQVIASYSDAVRSEAVRDHASTRVRQRADLSLLREQVLAPGGHPDAPRAGGECTLPPAARAHPAEAGSESIGARFHRGEGAGREGREGTARGDSRLQHLLLPDDVRLAAHRRGVSEE